MPTDASLSQAVVDAAKAYNAALAQCEDSIRTAQTNLTVACDAAQLAKLTMDIKADPGQPLKHPVGNVGYDPFLGRLKRVVVSRVSDL